MTLPRSPRLAVAALATVLASGLAPALGMGAATAAESTTSLSSLPWISAANGFGPVERDRSNGGSAAGDGRVLTLQGKTFARGLGVHANSDVRYQVPVGCNRFSSTAGLDDEVGSRGSVTFSVFDGAKRVYASGVRKGSSSNLTISVPVTPGQVLRLVVGDAGDGYGDDHADWADARLTCTTDAAAPAPTLVPNPGAEVDTSGWSGLYAGLTRSTSTVRTGAASFALTSSTTGDVLLLAAPTSNGIVPGASISVSAWVRSATTPRTALVQGDWIGANGYLTTSSTPPVVTRTGVWTQLTSTMVVPSGAVKGQFYVKVLGTVPGEVHHADDVVVTAAAPAGPAPSPAPTPTTPAPSPTSPAPSPTAPAPTPTSPVTPTTGPQGQAGTWQTSFPDEFDGSALDMSKWSDHEPWQSGGYVDTASWNPSPHTAQQVAVGGGQVALKARRGTGLPQAKGFTSAHLNTRGKFAIPAGVTSYTEARIKAPSGRGLLPGFWLLGNGDSSTGQGWPINGEIDILEFANNNTGEAGSPFFSLWFPKDVYTNAPGTWLNATHVYHTDTWTKRFDLYDSYHTWGLYRSPSKMELYIDGVKIATYRPHEVHNDNIPLPPMLFTTEQHIRLSLIVGGWGGTGYTEAQYQEGDLGVDYVKVWRQTGV